MQEGILSEIVDLAYAEAIFEELVERAAAGEEVIIAVDGVPRARLIPAVEAKSPRTPGGWEGQVQAAENINDPLPPEILRGVYGENEQSP